MKISYKWLCDLIPELSTLSGQSVAETLTRFGLEVEGVEDQAVRLEGIIVAQVISKEKHPQADRLNVCQVSDGKNQFQVVCGASNVQEGGVYPFATLGTTMPDGLVIKPVKLRNVDSFGMLCSAKELGWSDTSEGLLELDKELTLGQSIAKALEYDDVILEVNVTANRGDALGHWGIARELSASLGFRLNLNAGIDFVKPRKTEIIADTPFIFEITTQNLSERASVSKVNNVSVSASPLSVVRRLEALGLRSINNVVDATNLIMLLTGHPVHAYDAHQIAGRTLIIDFALASTKFKTLDEKEHELQAHDIVIRDQEKVLGLAGIMGGANSQICATTRDLVLEVAHFNPILIRRTAKRLGIKTDSSYRFERHVNVQTIVDAHELLQRLIVALAGGRASSIQTTPNAKQGAHAYQKRVVRVRQSEFKRLLGVEIEQKRIVDILTRLEFEVVIEDTNYLIQIPSYRQDVSLPADIVEEVLRTLGMESIPPVMPSKIVAPVTESLSRQLKQKLLSYFVAQGFYETIHYSFGDPEITSVLMNEQACDVVDLVNPISKDLSRMRTSLFPSLLQAYLKNRFHSEEGLRFFELRPVFKAVSANETEEILRASFFVAGCQWGRNRFGYNHSVTVYELMGIMSSLCNICDLGDPVFRRPVADYYDNITHLGQNFECLIAGQVIGFGGMLHPQLVQEKKISEACGYGEIFFDRLITIYQEQVKKLSISATNSLPPVHRDVALLMPEGLTYDKLQSAIVKFQPHILKSYRVFDRYCGDNVPHGFYSLALSFLYESDSETLTDESVNALHFELVDKLTQELGVRLR